MPAGTGVWVVNTVPARTAASASFDGQAAARRPACASAPAPRKPGVALVHVEDLGLRVARSTRAERPDRPDAADAEQDLLLDPVVLVAAVEPVGGGPQLVVVGLDVGVQQQQRHPADPGQPDPRGQLPAARHRHRDRQSARRPAPCTRSIGSPYGVVGRVVSCCQPSGGQRLAEVAVPVEQADADERHAQVGGRLQVVAGQDAEAAREVRQHLGQAELHREVGDGVRVGRRIAAAFCCSAYQRGSVR